jgi:TetR/AcrR family transcriptional regulator, cholesterol catabolism regulator
MRRSEIIQAAAQIFRQKGYNAASMQDIANAVNLQKSSLYHHVTSKQEILFSILEQTLDLFISELRIVVDSDLAADEKLRVAMQVYIGRLTDDADLSTVLLLEHRNLEHRLLDRHNARRDRYEELWRSILREGFESGIFRSFDIEVSTYAILGVQNWLITWYSSEDRLTAIELADHFSDLLLRGLLAEDKDK